MKKSIFFFFGVLFLFQEAHSQEVNSYKYVIVPEKYDFLDKKNEYLLNALTKFLFEKYGFTAVMQGEKLPEDLMNNRCAALHAEVISDSGMFSFVTKTKLILTDCNQDTLFESKEGRSRLKEMQSAYHEALRDAFSSVEALHYSYSGKPQTLIKKDSETILVKKSKLENRNEPLHFLKNGMEYKLEKQEKAFVLKKVGNENPVAFLNETSTGTFIYRSEKINGSAYFDGTGNLVVEYFDEKEGAMKKQIYVRSDPKD